MKKILTFAFLSVLVTSSSFATYRVVMKDGTIYRAKERWTVSNGKALIVQEVGPTLQVDPSMIDLAKTEATNKSGLGDVQLLPTSQPTDTAPARGQQSLGSITKIRDTNKGAATPAPRPAAPSGTSVGVMPLPTTGAILGTDVTSRFAAAFENVGIFDAKVTALPGNVIHVELTADNEDQVFKAISATSYVQVKMPELIGANVEIVELFMKTVNGGSSGRFQMTKTDAQAIVEKKITKQDYYVQKVIF